MNQLIQRNHFSIFKNHVLIQSDLIAERPQNIVPLCKKHLKYTFQKDAIIFPPLKNLRYNIWLKTTKITLNQATNIQAFSCCELKYSDYGKLKRIGFLSEIMNTEPKYFFFGKTNFVI